MRVLFSLLIFVICSWAGTIFNGGLEILSIKSSEAGDLKVDNKSVSWLNHPSKDGLKIAIIPASYYAKNDINITNAEAHHSIRSVLLK